MKKHSLLNQKSLAKSIIAMGLSVGMLFAPVLTGCKPNSPAVNDPNDSATTPGEGSTNNPTTNPGKDPGTNPGTTTNPYAGYSKTLQTVLTDEYYTNLLEELPANQSIAPSYEKYGYFVGHPYTFLKKQGYDIDAIKNGKQVCKTESYIMDGSFYFETLVEIADTEPYYDCYRLKCNITEKETEDLNMLFAGNYYEAPLFIQQLEKERNPEVVSFTKHTVNAYNNLTTSFRGSPKYSTKLIGNSNVNILLTSFSYDEEFGPRYHTYIIHDKNLPYIYSAGKGKLVELDIVTGYGIYGSEIVSGPLGVSSISIVEGFEPIVKDVVFYNTDGINNSHNLLINSSLTK